MTTRNTERTSIVLPNGCKAVHGTSADIKEPFTFTTLAMHELDAGGGHTYHGQFRFIPFRDDSRLPRHIHIGKRDGQDPHLVAERILVLNGVALTELAGEIYVAAPGTMVEIEPGVPHTWSACPVGCRVTGRNHFRRPVPHGLRILRADRLLSHQEYKTNFEHCGVREIQR
jgi:hypothetical protein